MQNQAGLDKTKDFTDELEGYRAQLTSSYLSDRDGEEAALRVEYDRLGEVLELSHIYSVCRERLFQGIRSLFMKRR